jgi:hypothetical protein
MASPISPLPPDRPGVSAGEAEAGGHTGAAHESYGPLDVERHVKDDGRALILYTREERERS